MIVVEFYGVNDSDDANPFFIDVDAKAIPSIGHTLWFQDLEVKVVEVIWDYDESYLKDRQVVKVIFG